MSGRPGSRNGRFSCHLGPVAAAGSAVALLLALVATPTSLFADVQQDRRAESGLKLFRALLSADLDLDRKAGDDRKLLIVLFFTDDRKRADELAKTLGSRDGRAETIHGLPLAVETTADPKFASFERRLPAGIFLTQAPDARTLQEIIRFGVANRLVVYSPFEGHVESGVLGGLAVEAQVRPYLNQATLSASRISLKEFFLSVAKVYR